MFSRAFSRLLRRELKRNVAQPLRELHNQIGLLGVPLGKGQTCQGVAQAPQMLRQAGLISKLRTMGYDVTDFGDLQFEQFRDDATCNNINQPKTIGNATHKIFKNVNKIIESGRICLTIGGDHSMSIGTVYGHAKAQPNMTLVWVDAHADINLPSTSMSGHIHGMVLSFLVHELSSHVPTVKGFEWIKPCISAKDIAYIGLRDLDPAERHIIEHYGIACYTMHEIDRHGIDYVLEKAMDRINPGLKRPIHMSYDVDALDPVVSPSTGTPVPGGLTIREGMFIAEEMALTDQLIGLDVVEVNPVLGNQKEQALTLFTAVELITACFGRRRMGNIPQEYQLPLP